MAILPGWVRVPGLTRKIRVKKTRKFRVLYPGTGGFFSPRIIYGPGAVSMAPAPPRPAYTRIINKNKKIYKNHKKENIKKYK